MFCETISSIPDFCDKSEPQCNMIKAKTAQKLRTRLEQQKESRYKVLSNRRDMKPPSGWEDDPDIGYQSDQSSDSRSSAVSLDQINHLDVLRALMACQQSSESEAVLNTAVSASLVQLEGVGNDFEVISHMTANFFSSVILNKMSSFIGFKGIRISIQMKVLKLYEELVVMVTHLADELIRNLMESPMIPKLIEILVLGNEVSVDRSLQLLLLLLENNSSAELLTHILNSGFVDLMILRADNLRWKTGKARSWELKTNRRQRVSQNNFSSEAKVLFRLFARAVFRLIAIDMDDSIRMALLIKMTPLLNRFLACPDPKVIPSAIDSFRMFVRSKNTLICSVIVDTFGRIIFTITDKTEDPIIFSLLQLFNTFIVECPQLFTYQDFGSNLMSCLDKIVGQKRNNHKLDTEMTTIISNISQWLVTDVEPIRQLSYRLINLLLILLSCGDRCNRLNAIEAIEVILYKYSFQSIINLMNIFDFRGLIIQLLISDESQKTGLNICAHILNILRDCYDLMPEKAEDVKQQLFSKSSDIYYCLEKLSYKTFNELVSKRANQLMKQMESKLNDDEDKGLLPKINENRFVFGPSF